MGLVDHVLPEEGFVEAGRALAEQYAQTPHGAAVATKRMIRTAFDTDFDAAFQYSREAVAGLLGSDEVAAGRKASMARRGALRLHDASPAADAAA